MRSAASRLLVLERGHEARLGLPVEIVEDLRHHLVRVAAPRLREVRHEFGAQRLSTRSSTSFCTASIFSMRLMTSSASSSGRMPSTRAACSGLIFAEHHRHRLRVFVLEVVGEHLFLDVGKLFPHIAAGGAADLLHDAADALGRQELLQQPLGGVVVAHQRAGRRHPSDELEQQVLDRLRVDSAERRHHDRKFAQFVVVEHAPDLAAVLVAEREHQHGGALRPGELAAVPAAAAGKRRHHALDVAFRLFFVLGGCGHGGRSGCAFVEPGSDDGNGFGRIAVHQLADALHRLGVDLALHLGDINHLGGLVGYGLDLFRGCAGGDRALHVAARKGRGDRGLADCAHPPAQECGGPAAARP